MTKQHMEYIILAAGQGKRLGAYSQDTPKCLIEVGKKNIFEMIIENIDPMNEIRKIVVIGEEGSCWKKENQGRFNKYPVEVTVNTKNMALGNAYSLYLALVQVQQWPVIILDGDLVFKKEIFEQLVNAKDENVLLSRPMNSEDKGGIIRVGNDHRILEIGETVAGEGPYFIYAGMAKISRVLGHYLIEHLQEHSKVVDAINQACQSFEVFNESFSGKDKWININTPDKLEEARKAYGQES